MEVCDLKYYRPQTLQEACELGRTFGEEGRYLAGGTELLVDFKRKRDQAEYLISLQDVPDLKNVIFEDSLLRIGAMATLTDIADSPLVAKVFPVLREAILTMGSLQIRNQATIGGNFCRAVPCADTPPICIAGDARLRLVGIESDRVLPAATFFTGPRQTVRQSGEILTEIQIPTQPAHSGANYQRFSLRRGSALAVASVAALVILDGEKIAEARVILGSVAPVPLPATQCVQIVTGQKPTDDLFARAGKAAASEAQPITDIRGSKEYRRDLVKVLTARALKEATVRAQGAPA